MHGSFEAVGIIQETVGEISAETSSGSRCLSLMIPRRSTEGYIPRLHGGPEEYNLLPLYSARMNYLHSSAAEDCTFASVAV